MIWHNKHHLIDPVDQLKVRSYGVDLSVTGWRKFLSKIKKAESFPMRPVLHSFTVSTSQTSQLVWRESDRPLYSGCVAFFYWVHWKTKRAELCTLHHSRSIHENHTSQIRINKTNQRNPTKSLQDLQSVTLSLFSASSPPPPSRPPALFWELDRRRSSPGCSLSAAAAPSSPSSPSSPPSRRYPRRKASSEPEWAWGGF